MSRCMEWNGVGWNGVAWNGVEWSGMEWNGTLQPELSCLNKSQLVGAWTTCVGLGPVFRLDIVLY